MLQKNTIDDADHVKLHACFMNNKKTTTEQQKNNKNQA